MNLGLLKLIRIVLLGLVSIGLTLLLVPLAIAQHKAIISIPKKISNNTISHGKSISTSTKKVAKPRPTKNEKVGVLATQTSQLLIAQNTKMNSSTATSAMMTTAIPINKVAKEEGKFAAELGAEYGRNLIHHDDEKDEEEATYSTTLKYKVLQNYTTLFFAELIQDLRKRKETDFGKSALGISRDPWTLGSIYQFSPSISFGLPLSKELRERSSFQTSLSAKGSLGLDLASTSFSALKVGASISFARNFHKYDTTTKGEVNTQYSSVQEFTLGYALSDHWEIGTLSRHINTWSYQGNMKDTFLFAQSIGYSPIEAFTVSLGHANGGSTLKENGYDSNIEVLNKNTSAVSLGAEYRF
ncbi:MAG: hypothetical protein AB7O96_02515 [Pseudobdellovibrionaceae bacterium]